MAKTGWYFVYNRVVPAGPCSKDRVEQCEVLLSGQTEEKALEEAKIYWEAVKETEKEDKERRKENGLPTLPNIIFLNFKSDPHIIRRVFLLPPDNKR